MPLWQQIVDRIIEEAKLSKDFYPIEPPHNSGWSHEGYEFTKGILHAFISWLEDSSNFQNLVKKHKLATDEAFQSSTSDMSGK